MTPTAPITYEPEPPFGDVDSLKTKGFFGALFRIALWLNLPVSVFVFFAAASASNAGPLQPPTVAAVGILFILSCGFLATLYTLDSIRDSIERGPAATAAALRASTPKRTVVDVPVEASRAMRN
jgi:hypothetical protein